MRLLAAAERLFNEDFRDRILAFNTKDFEHCGVQLIHPWNE
jgi:hypothetical protein